MAWKYNFTWHKEKALFDALRAYRLELAKEKNVPPYVIFHDKTLLEMVNAKPTSLASMAYISGIGEAKLNTYGDSFLNVITAHLAH